MTFSPFNLGNLNASSARSIAEQYANDLLRTRGGTYQHAILGEVAFDLITYFTGTEVKYGAEYAEHRLIEGKPRQQWLGDKLDEITWSLLFHTGFCDPEKELQKLCKLIVEHTPAPLHYANGDYKGTFLPVECTVTSRQTRFVYERVVGFVMGRNVFIVNAILALFVKALTMAFCWSVAIVLAPIGLLYLYFKRQS